LATITQIRGALLEEAVLFLLTKVGYAPIDQSALVGRPTDELRIGHSGLEVRGRGTWHQLDAFARWNHSPAFMYPLNLVVEAKCYASTRPVGVEVPQNSVGVLKDISENYFSIHSRLGATIPAPRYNYAAAIFSTSGFTRGAVEYAVAHQVFLIQYDHVPVIEPLVSAILAFDESCIRVRGKEAISAVRKAYRSSLNDRVVFDDAAPEVLTDRGWMLIRGSIAESCRRIRGSYFGMLQGRWPLHLLRQEPLPPQAFQVDTIQCRVIGNDHNEWRFVPFETRHADEDRWFELEFSLPPAIAELVAEHWEDAIAVANIKQQHFSYIDLSGVIGDIRRTVRLELNEGWINEYVQRRRAEI
jgi:hypothetical protein